MQGDFADSVLAKEDRGHWQSWQAAPLIAAVSELQHS